MFLHEECVDDSYAIIQVLLVKNNQMNITDLPQIPHCNQGKKNGDGHTHSFLLSPEFLVVRGEVEEVVAYSFDVRSQKWPAVHSICVCVCEKDAAAPSSSSREKFGGFRIVLVAYAKSF